MHRILQNSNTFRQLRAKILDTSGKKNLVELNFRQCRLIKSIPQCKGETNQSHYRNDNFLDNCSIFGSNTQFHKTRPFAVIYSLRRWTIENPQRRSIVTFATMARSNGHRKLIMVDELEKIIRYREYFSGNLYYTSAYVILVVPSCLSTTRRHSCAFIWLLDISLRFPHLEYSYSIGTISWTFRRIFLLLLKTYDTMKYSNLHFHSYRKNHSWVYRYFHDNSETHVSLGINILLVHRDLAQIVFPLRGQFSQTNLFRGIRLCTAIRIYHLFGNSVIVAVLYYPRISALCEPRSFRSGWKFSHFSLIRFVCVT